jgi:LmbE family N-acetylglucosaminyl deacetylase
MINVKQDFRSTHRISMKLTLTSAGALARCFLLLLLCLAALFAVPVTLAQQTVTLTTNARSERAALHQSLLDLSNPWTVMCVAAHPDDEDGATLTVLRRKYGVHTVTVFSTYGEGGQNATGPELYEELGAIRARETLAAAEIQGSEAWFLALRDFGFSKSAEEAFRIWGHDEALSRLVLKIRTLRPDVIITNHDADSGHGHHQATGRLVLEAFDAAADERRFPEQLRKPGVRPWQAQRIFVRVKYESGTGSRALEEAAERAGKIITVNPNERDALRGSTYAEQALQALHRHASQGPWPQAVPESGVPLIRYRLAREADRAVPLPANAQTFLDELRLPAEVAALFAPPTIDNRPLVDFIAQPERVFDAIMTARKEGRLSSQNTANKIEPPQLKLIKERTQSALAASSGITATLTPQEKVFVPQTQASFSLTISNRGQRAATIKGVQVSSWQGLRNVKFPALLMPGATLKRTLTINVPKNIEVNLPRSAHLYDERLFGQQVRALIKVAVKDESFSLPVNAQVDIAAAVEVARISPSPFVFTPGNINRPQSFTFNIINHQRAAFAGRVGSVNPADRFSFSNVAFNLASNEARNIAVRMPDNMVGALAFDARQSSPAMPKNLRFMIYPARSSKPITQGTIPIIYSDARVAPNLRVGYIRSFDDTLRDALGALGVEAKELTIDDVRAGDLRGYSTIIVDNRGYQAHAELVSLNSRLLEYVHTGGTLIVFYHKANEWNPDAQKKRTQLAPYPITLGNARVTNEAAPVAFMEADSALLNFPNKIETKDFDGWIQERGLYYPKEWDARYSAPLSTGDAGEAPLRGGLLAADYGRGQYIYTSIVWYRQLRAGIPGAYRLFANMISYGHTAGATGNAIRR